MPRRIRWREVLPYVVLLLAVVIALVLVSLNYFRQQEETRQLTNLTQTAQMIAFEVQQGFLNSGGENGLATLEEKIESLIDISVTIMDLEGNLIGSSAVPNDSLSNLLNLPAVTTARVQGTATAFSEGLPAAAVAITDQDDRVIGIVQVQADAADFQSDLSQILVWGILIFLVGTAGILLISLIVQDRSQVPVEKLTIAAQQISLGQFNDLDFPDESPELGDLSHALREMAQHLGNQISALTTERAKLSAILNQMTDGVLIADEKGRVQLLNYAAERLFQRDKDASVGRSVVEVLRYPSLVEVWSLAKEGERQSAMLEIGAEHLFLQVIGIPLRTSLPGSTMILFQDLTQLRRLETVRRDFISNVSHELRTPLASLKALAETLQEGALEDPPAARRFILLMETEIDNLTQLVNELLELSRIESGKVPLSFNRIQPCELLKPAYDRMVLQADRAGLTLVFDCQPDLPAVFADPDRISQVMINLVHNAIKFTPSGGKITVSAQSDGDHIVFAVRDTGVGIARKNLGRIFERFYKTDRARTGGGTGLGLSIARHMIESHGGYIWAESEEGVGSTLLFTLPIA